MQNDYEAQKYKLLAMLWMSRLLPGLRCEDHDFWCIPCLTGTKMENSEIKTPAMPRSYSKGGRGPGVSNNWCIKRKLIGSMNNGVCCSVSSEPRLLKQVKQSRSSMPGVNLKLHTSQIEFDWNPAYDSIRNGWFTSNSSHEPNQIKVCRNVHHVF